MSEGRISGSYIGTMLIGLYFTSLLFGGFVHIFYTFLMTLREFPLIVVGLNMIGYLYLLYAYLVNQDKLDGFGKALVDLLLLWFLPIAPLLGAIGLLIGAIILYNEDAIDTPISVVVGGILIASLLIVAVPLAMYGNILVSHTIKTQELEDPIDTYGAYRLIPLYTAYTYATDRIQLPTHTVYMDETYIYYQNKTPVYNWIVEPEGFLNSLLRDPYGIILVKGDRYPAHVELIQRPLKYSLHKLYFRGVYFDTLRVHANWLALGHKVLYDENVEIVYEGKVYIILPMVSFKQTLFYSYHVPAGFIVVDEDGNFEKVSLEQAKTDPRFKGVPLVPESVAREWADLYRYHVGFIQFYFQHNTYEIRDVGDNPQPYLVVSEDNRLYWVFIVEPAGNTYSVKHIIYVPADVEEPYLEIYTPDKMMIGVSKVVSYVTSNHPEYDWERFKVVEPMPTIINGTIYWTVKIITADHRGFVALDIIDAYNGTINTINFQSMKIANPEIVLSYMGHSQPVSYQENDTMSINDVIQSLRDRINATIEELNSLVEELARLEESLNQTNP